MKIKFKSGREYDANCGIFGITEMQPGKFEITEGYDSDFQPWPPGEHADPETAFSADDMREMADMMIDRWTRFKASLEGK